MRSLLLAVVATLTLTASASSQPVSGIFPSPPYCPTCFVASYTDTVAPGGVMPVNTHIYGWAANCYNGSQVTGVTATAVVSGQPQSVTVYHGAGLYRPDVDAHLRANGCASQAYAGLHFWFPSAFPSGTTAVSVRFHYDQTFAYHVYQVE